MLTKLGHPEYCLNECLDHYQLTTTSAITKQHNEPVLRTFPAFPKNIKDSQQVQGVYVYVHEYLATAPLSQLQMALRFIYFFIM